MAPKRRQELQLVWAHVNGSQESEELEIDGRAAWRRAGV